MIIDGDRAYTGQEALARAGMLARDERFQVWARVFDEEGAAAFIRAWCGVDSRASIAHQPEAVRKLAELDWKFTFETSTQDHPGHGGRLNQEKGERESSQQAAVPAGATVSPDHPGEEGHDLFQEKGESATVVANNLPDQQNPAPPRDAPINVIKPRDLPSGGMNWIDYAIDVLDAYRATPAADRKRFVAAQSYYLDLFRHIDKDASTDLRVAMSDVEAGRS